MRLLMSKWKLLVVSLSVLEPFWKSPENVAVLLAWLHPRELKMSMILTKTRSSSCCLGFPLPVPLNAFVFVSPLEESRTWTRKRNPSWGSKRKSAGINTPMVSGRRPSSPQPLPKALHTFLRSTRNLSAGLCRCLSSFLGSLGLVGSVAAARRVSMNFLSCDR